MSGVKVLVTGDREWRNVAIVKAELMKLPDGSILIHGACRGLDLMVDAVAKTTLRRRRFDIRPYAANWKQFGRAAGPIRNQQMLEEEHIAEDPINLCLGFHDDIINSKGTKDMMIRSILVGIKTRLVTSSGDLNHESLPGSGFPSCKFCGKSLTEWRAFDECSGRDPSMLIF